MSLLERAAVKRVRTALANAGLDDSVMEMSDTARSAEDAAKAVGCELGAIVKSLIFTVDQRFVMAMVAGDHECLENNLPGAFDLDGPVGRPQASEVKAITGFTIGGVAPIGMTARLPMVIDRSLKRFETIYAAAGHPHCVFPIAFAGLQRLTGAIVRSDIATPIDGAAIGAPRPAPRRTFDEGRQGRHTDGGE